MENKPWCIEFHQNCVVFRHSVLEIVVIELQNITGSSQGQYSKQTQVLHCFSASFSLVFVFGAEQMAMKTCGSLCRVLIGRKSQKPEVEF